MRRMYGMFTYIYHKFRLNVGRYSIHGAFGYCKKQVYYCIDSRLLYSVLKPLRLFCFFELVRMVVQIHTLYMVLSGY